ncbi:MAG: hypothetical protein CVU84_06570 [Firmicutes bacterium HGW-Firmicutes-1]|jgi:signal transduction histidine kinase|nr:MAG: hypothetical protein CVU84_06570 [Firmicutes bacterium HGW-Firmicutes-1]
MNEIVPNALHIFGIVVLLLASTLLLVFYFVYIYVKAKPSYFIKKYIIAHLLLLLWLVVLLLEYMVVNNAVRINFSYLKDAMMVFVGYNIFLFAYSYSYKRPMDQKLSVLWCSIPCIAFILLIASAIGGSSNQALKLRYIYGTLIIGYLLVGIVFFIYYNLKTEGLNRTKQSLYFIAAIGFDLLAHIVFYLGTLNVKHDIFILFMFLYLSGLIGVTIKYQMYDKIPFVLESVLNNANYGIIVINNKLEIVDLNKDFFKQYITIEAINKLEDMMNQFKSISDNKLSVDNILCAVKEVEQNQFTGELRINIEKRDLHLFYTVSSIFDERQQKIATMITFRDMTQMMHLQKGIIHKNDQLLKANKKLEEHMENMKELTVEKERNVLMTEINDTFGHSMTEIMALLEVCGLLLEQEERDEVVEIAIRETTSRARDALDEMRQAVSRYKKGVGLND